MGASGAAVSGSAFSAVPPEQADTNNARTRNQAALRFMIRVFHESRSVTQRESRRAPLRLRNLGKPWAADCDNLCHQVPVTEPESTDGPEISGLPSWLSWWSWGESKHRNLSRTSAWTASARGFNDVCLTGMSVSVWCCAFCAMKCATRRADQKAQETRHHSVHWLSAVDLHRRLSHPFSIMEVRTERTVS